MIDPRLLKMLACPVCKADVLEKEGTIVCTRCQRRYPVKNNIPIMLAEEAQNHEKK